MAYKVKMFLLAIVVVSMFLATAVAISFQNYWLVALFFIGGIVVMMLGLMYKRKYLAASKNLNH